MVVQAASAAVNGVWGARWVRGGCAAGARQGDDPGLARPHRGDLPGRVEREAVRVLLAAGRKPRKRRRRERVVCEFPENCCASETLRAGGLARAWCARTAQRWPPSPAWPPPPPNLPPPRQHAPAPAPTLPCAAAWPSWKAVRPSRLTTSPPSDTSISRDEDTCAVRVRVCGGCPGGCPGGGRDAQSAPGAAPGRRREGGTGKAAGGHHEGGHHERGHWGRHLRGLEEALEALLDDVEGDEDEAHAVGKAREHLVIDMT